MNSNEIRNIIHEVLKQRLSDAGMTADTLDDDTSLIDLGVIDSFGFLELTGELEEKTGVLMDFSEVDPEEFTSVSGLLKVLSPE